MTVPTSSSGYTAGNSRIPSVGTVSAYVDDEANDPITGYWELSKCQDAYTTYLNSKRPEIDEQQDARRYRHGVQWTSEQIKTLNERKQPVVTYNRIGRKIDGIVGLVERLRQDPKAYPRTPIHQQGADLATACLRYLTESNKWAEKSPLVSEFAAVDGLAGIELGLKLRKQRTQAGVHISAMQQGPDWDVILNVVDNDGFFYDPRSVKHDFSDARYMGVGKYVDEELLCELMPQHEDLIRAGGNDSELTSNSDKDQRWFKDNGDFKQVRLVDIWYQHKGGWCWALFTGAYILEEGPSPFQNEYGEQFCKYIMFSAAVDNDGDRYGFPRNLKSAQDEINQRRSKALHELNSRRIRATKAAIADNNVEALRREAAKSDGILLSHTSIDEIQFDDQIKQAQIMGQLEMMREAKSELENFGPNPAVLGDAGIGAKSGRAIQMIQQAGIAELGPYMVNLRAWKNRVYTALFNAAQKYWTQERWIRVTDNQGEPQHVPINMQTIDQEGKPQMVNQIGELDVDIILDEGPDTITIAQDTYDAIAQALPALGRMLTPAAAQAVMEVMIETAPLPADVKKKFRDAGQQAEQQPGPEQQKMQAEMQMKQADQQMKQQSDMASLQLEGAKVQQQGQAELQKAAVQAQIKREQAALDAQLEREKAQNDMELERFKTFAKLNIEREKALSGPQLRIPGI